MFWRYPLGVVVRGVRITLCGGGTRGVILDGEEVVVRGAVASGALAVAEPAYRIRE